MPRIIFHRISVLVFVLLVGDFCFAQGTQDDYQRMERLGRTTANKVFRDRVVPNWLNGEQYFWYRVKSGPQQFEFIFVDVERGIRKPAFDHQVVASELGKLTGDEFEPAALPFSKLNYNEDLSSIYVKAKGSHWLIDVETSSVSTAKKDQIASQKRSFKSLRPSVDLGGEVYLTFENKTSERIRLIWIDRAGERVPYEWVEPNKTTRQHTFAGHIWLIVNESGEALEILQADAGDTEIEIDGKTKLELEDAEPTPSSRQRSNRSASSPDQNWRAFLKNNNLYVRDEDGNEIQLTEDGTDENSLDRSFYWSPDSKFLVCTQTRQGDRRLVYLIESSPSNQLQPRLHQHSYLKPGDKIPQRRPRLFDIQSEKEIKLDERLFSNPWSLSNFRWNSDSSELTFLFNQRGHQVMRVIGVSTNGDVRAVVDEQSKTFISYTNRVYSHFIGDNELIWMSERDGWNHLYLYDVKTGDIKNQITRGKWIVRGVDQIDEVNRQIWFRASGIVPGQDPYYVHHCRVDFDGENLTVLTEGDGTHRISYSPERKVFLDTYSRVDLPPVTTLRRTADGSLVSKLEAAEWGELLKTEWKPTLPFSAKGRDDKTDIFGVIYFPTNFDEQKQYPVIEYIYAGPHNSFVPKRFSVHNQMRAMAELGFIVVQIDGMGTANRSKAFHDVCWKNLGDSGFPDRIRWLKAAAEQYPQMDLHRVGIYGGSAGGQSTLRALLAHGDFYKVGVSDCGCHDNRMDKIWWNEQWMGWPIGPHYAEQSNVTNAHKLTGKLLLIVGELDRNVDPASTMQVVNALIKADKDFDLIVVPGGGHGIGSGRYGMRRTRDFFVRHLHGVEPRRSE